MALEEYGYTVTFKDVNQTFTATEYQIQARTSGGGTFARDNSQATMTYTVEYDTVDRFIDVVLGKTTIGSGGYLKRSAATPIFDSTQGSLPDPHPYWSNFYAATADVQPIGQADQEWWGPTWTKTAVTVVYRPTTYNVIPDDEYESATEIDRFVTKINEGSSDFQTAQGQFKFVTDPQHRPLEIQPGIVIASQKMSYTWHQIPVKVDTVTGIPDLGQIPNIDTVMLLLGTVNVTAFDGYPPGTVLFNSYTSKLVLPQAASEDNYYWDITYNFGYRNYGASTIVVGENIGWNYAYDPVRHVWDLYTTDGTTGGQTMYTYGQLNPLFQVTW